MINIRTYTEENVMSEDLRTGISSSVTTQVEQAAALTLRNLSEASAVRKVDNGNLIDYMKTGILIKDTGSREHIGVIGERFISMPLLDLSHRVRVKVPAMIIMSYRGDVFMGSRSLEGNYTEVYPFTNAYSGSRTYSFASQNIEARYLCVGDRIESYVYENEYNDNYDIIKVAEKILTANPNRDLTLRGALSERGLVNFLKRLTNAGVEAEVISNAVKQIRSQGNRFNVGAEDNYYNAYNGLLVIMEAFADYTPEYAHELLGYAFYNSREANYHLLPSFVNIVEHYLETL